MQTLKQADDLWMNVEEHASGPLSILEQQIHLKSRANQELANKICQLEDDLEKARKKLVAYNLLEAELKLDNEAKGDNFKVATLGTEEITRNDAQLQTDLERARTQLAECSLEVEKLEVKTKANQELADKICELEDQLEITGKQLVGYKSLDEQLKLYASAKRQLLDRIAQLEDQLIKLGIQPIGYDSIENPRFSFIQTIGRQDDGMSNKVYCTASCEYEKNISYANAIVRGESRKPMIDTRDTEASIVVTMANKSADATYETANKNSNATTEMRARGTVHYPSKVIFIGTNVFANVGKSTSKIAIPENKVDCDNYDCGDDVICYELYEEVKNVSILSINFETMM